MKLKRIALASLCLASTVVVPAAQSAGPSRAKESGSQRRPDPRLGDPRRFLRDVVADVASNDYAHAWLSLYPPHQDAAPLDEYVACELKSPIPGHLDALVVLRSVRGRFAVAGQAQPLYGAAVTFRIRISEPSLAASVQLQATFHALAFGGRWRWILPVSRYTMYLDDAC